MTNNWLVRLVLGSWIEEQDARIARQDKINKDFDDKLSELEKRLLEVTDRERDGIFASRDR